MKKQRGRPFRGGLFLHCIDARGIERITSGTGALMEGTIMKDLQLCPRSLSSAQPAAHKALDPRCVYFCYVLGVGGGLAAAAGHFAKRWYCGGRTDEEIPMKIPRILGCAVAAALMAGCASAAVQTQTIDPGIQPFPVILKVQGDQGSEELVSKNSKTPGCNKFPDQGNYRKGCIVAALNEMVDVRFNLVGSGDWYLAQFQICNVEASENNNEIVKPADFGECYLTDAQRADWLVLANSGVAAPDENGLVDIMDFGTGLKTFELRDFNWTKATYFYRIQACVDEPGEDGSVHHRCKWMDPGGENTGRGYNIR
ncbi:MAG: hypothetical protein PVI46_01615 [Lysobacterales bacterium]